MAFFMRKQDEILTEEFPIPDGEIYEPWRDTMIGWIKETRALPCQDFSITSFDGLTLKAKYFECKAGAPIELMFHGYRGNAERDLCGGVQRCFALGHNAFIVDQRACGNSDGSVITFGINESKDCHAWLELMINHFGPDVKIILTGISMGASTVLNAAGSPLPEQVVGVLADCGFTSPADIIKVVITEMGLPANLAYPFVKLGAKLYGKFDLDEISSVDAIKNCKVPVIFFHGEDDAFVPCEMSRRNYVACTAKKQLVTIPGAGHGLCYPVDPQRYLDEMRKFFN
jgi:pimeloyl-ACP methyl ester carboxylesterase